MHSETAATRFREGFNCSQSVLLAYAEELGLTAEQAARLSTPFGGGIGRQGEVCGAASGGLMALGLQYGNTVPDRAAKERVYRIATEFMRRFQERQGAIRCRDLLGVELSTPEGNAEARDRGLFKTVCPGAVRTAAEIVDELLAEELP